MMARSEVKVARVEARAGPLPAAQWTGSNSPWFIGVRVVLLTATCEEEGLLSETSTSRYYGTILIFFVYKVPKG